jgi:alpha-L-fucosidase
MNEPAMNPKRRRQGGYDMSLSRRDVIATSFGASIVFGAGLASPLKAEAARVKGRLMPHGATPSPRQLSWQKRLNYGFIHFTVNTFTDREWGYGDEPESVFNPTDFSADQIVMAAKAGGLNGLILTAKHHDGFCLWPSAYTEHCIRNSPYKDGKGDIVGEMAKACRTHGVDFGVYLSPWDRNRADYGTPSYVTYYHNQLRELLSGYGRLFEIWFDGANGGDGYYGGSREARHIDAATYYQWDVIRAIVRQLQPNAVIFSEYGGDIRWVGNEEGVAGDPCWPTVTAAPYTQKMGNSGEPEGSIWDPAETDVSIRPGWFWHADEKPRSPANLIDLYFKSVGRGSNLLLNIPPDRRGRIADSDVASLKAWRNLLDQTFNVNLAASARVSASSQSTGRPASDALEGEGFWAAAAGEADAAWVRFDLPEARTFNVIRLGEDIRLGLRTDTFAIDIETDEGWLEIALKQCIDNIRLVRLQKPVTTAAIRVRFVKTFASPTLGAFGLFRLPDVIDEPSIERDRKGMVTLRVSRPDLSVHYTLDGQNPTAQSPLYTAPFELEDAGRVAAIAIDPTTGAQSAVASEEFEVSPVQWRILSANSNNPGGALGDGLFIGKEGQPAEFVIDLGRNYALAGFTLKPFMPDIHMPLAEVARIGSPTHYRVTISDTQDFRESEDFSGELSNIAASRALQHTKFGRSVNGRFMRFTLSQPIEGRTIVGFNGVGILTK